MKEFAPNPALSQAIADLTIARGEVSALIGDHVDYTLAPQASGADYSHARPASRLTGPRARIGAVLLGAGAALSGLAGVGGAAGQGPTEAPRTQDPGTTSTPEFGTPEPGGSGALPSPSEGPITGVVPTCPPGTILAMVEGQAIQIRVAAQENPSEPPTSAGPLEGIDINGDGVVDEKDDTNGDGVIDENDRETALTDPECINLDDYSLQWLIDQGYDPINKKQFMKAARRNAPTILEYTKNLGIPFLDSEEEIVADYERIADSLAGRPKPEDMSHELIGSIRGHMNLVAPFARSDMRLANAHRNMANAMRKLGQSSINFGTDDGEVIDRKMDKLIEEYSLSQ